VEVTEGFLCPDIQPPLLGVAGGELNDHQPLGDEKEEKRQHPETEGAETRRRRNGNPPQPGYGDDVEED